MKRHLTLPLLTALTALNSVQADPLLTSWFTENSGSYARIYTDNDAVTNDVTSTTWSKGAGIQNLPTYAGVHELSYTNEWLYLRSTNLASYTMGPWNAGNFPNYPANNSATYRFPRTPAVSSSTSADAHTYTDKTLTSGGFIGYMVNGVSIFDSRDAFSWNPETNDDQNARNGGDEAWNRDAYVSEGNTFDRGFAHQASLNHHYHSQPPALRYQLGDSVDLIPANLTNAITNPTTPAALASSPYQEVFNGNHSPIIGWMADGIPVYGPYGYDIAMDAESDVTRMISGFQLRNITTRISWPQWATNLYGGLTPAQLFTNGPDVSAQNPLGKYLEDYDYKGDIGQVYGIDFHLNEFNTRYCVTPEYPTGTWAYFTCIAENGEPVFPYNTVRAYLGVPTGGTPSAIPDTDDTTSDHVIYFEGGPESKASMYEILKNSPTASDVTITWNTVEGGTYTVQESTDLGDTDPWEEIATDIVADASLLSLETSFAAGAPEKDFYRIARSGVAPFDDAGFQHNEVITASPTGEAVTFSFTFEANNGALPADTSELPISLTFGSETVDIASANLSRPARRQLQFDFSTFGLAPGDYVITATFAGGSTGTYTYTIEANILFMIVDDWGIDRSPIDSSEPNAILPNMPNLAQLASEGLQFTNAFAQPQCSPTRATIMTGRQPSQHNVGVPESAGQFSTDEITIPEIFTLQGAPHGMLSVGKWHLGGNDSAYSTRGGWPEFYGIQSGGVANYSEWDKNSNGSAALTTTYSTTDQVNETVSFIEANTALNQPWFAWVAFNAPHSPFHAPPAELAPVGGYTAPANANNFTAEEQYIQMLEALDTEIGRLLESVDPAQTHIIIIGDNGTPNQVVQAPFDNGHAKGSIYQGGIRVPMVIKSPSATVAAGSTSEQLVHCVDLFSTMLEFAGIDESTVTELSTQDIQSKSLLPILEGTDITDKDMVAEIGSDSEVWQRAIIIDEFPDYKLIVTMDPTVIPVTTNYEFYKIDTDVNEQTDLGTPAGGRALNAYNACMTKNTELGDVYTP